GLEVFDGFHGGGSFRKARGRMYRVRCDGGSARGRCSGLKSEISTLKSQINSRAVSNTSRSIVAVNRPVNVFCWLGWKEQTTNGAFSNRWTNPCPNAGRPRGGSQPRARYS